jgi:hypothetical protein
VKNFINGELTLDEVKVQERIRTKLLNAGQLFELSKHHTLIIGLGGTGLRFAKATKKLLYQRYKEKDVSQRAKFIFVDTAQNSFVSDGAGKGMGKEEKVFLSNAGVKGFEQHGYPTYITQWLNDKVEPEELCDGNGAAGIRQAGRCLLFANIETLRTKIQTIFEGFGQRQIPNGIIQTNVFIIAGLAGGTGSGTFVDVTFLVHKIAADKNLNALKVFGVFELPDSSVKADPNQNDDVRRYRSYGNGYAALKELDYFMKVRQRDNKPHYKAQFGLDLEPFEWHANMYERALLFSSEGITKEGESFPKNPIHEEGEPRPVPYLTHAIPEVINLIISKPVEQLEDFFHISEQLCNGTHGYCSAGVSKLEVSKEKIVLCVTVRLFYELMARWDLQPTDTDITRIVDMVGIRNLRGRVTSALESVLEDYDDDDLKSSDLENKFKGDFTAKVARISHQDWRQTYQQTINTIYEEKGPTYVIRLKNMAEQQINTALSALQSNSAGITEKQKDFKKAGTFAKAKARGELLDALQLAADINGTLTTLVRARLNIMDKINNEIFQPVTKLVELFTELLEKLTGIKVATRRHITGNTEVFSCDLSDVPYNRINSKISDMFVKKVTFSDGTSKTVTGDLYKVGNDGKEGFPIYYKKHDPSNAEFIISRPPDRAFDDKKVIAIEDRLVINGTEKEFDFNQIARDLLREVSANIKDRPGEEAANRVDDPDRLDILDILIDKVKFITDQIVRWQFEDILLMLGRDENIARGVRIEGQARMERLEESVKLFYKYSIPSFPLRLDFQDNFSRQEKYELTIKPQTSRDFNDILVRCRNCDQGQISVVEQASTLLDIVLYLNISLSSYDPLRRCIESYEWCKNPRFPSGQEKRDLWSGIHLSEGKEQGWDWREFLVDIPINQVNES